MGQLLTPAASFFGTRTELAEFLSEDIPARQGDACRAFLLDKD